MVGRTTPTTAKYTAHITTVDPTQRIVGGVMAGDAQERGISVISTPVAFRWPTVNEAWVVRYENGLWFLDGVYPALTSPTPFTAIPAGDLILNTPTGIVHVSGSVDGSTDFQFQANSVPSIQGRATLVAGTATVLTPKVTANSNIILTAQDNNSTGTLRISSRSPGTSFVITSSNGIDHGSVAYMIFG